MKINSVRLYTGYISLNSINKDACGAVNGINKDVCGAKLQPTTVLAYPVD